MPTEYLVLKGFDYHPKPSVVMAFKKGEKRVGLPKGAIDRGLEISALKETKAPRAPAKKD